MNDLISREQAINRIKKQCEHLHPESDSRDYIGQSAYHICIGILEVLPSAEPIIRCKDCKWCREHYDTDGNAPYWICTNWDGGTDADGFCHEAERKDQ